MKNHILAAAALSLCSGVALAQYPLQGFLQGWDRGGIGNGISFSGRWGLTGAEEHLMRIDSDDYKEWGLNSAGQVQIQGFVVYVLDSNDATREAFSIRGYAEDPNRPNFPLLTTPIVNAGPYQMPPTGATPGPAAYRLYTTFAAPATMPSGVDLFIGTGVPAPVSATQPYDALWTGLVSADPTSPGTPPTFDTPGPAGQAGQRIAQDTYACYIFNGLPNYATSTSANPVVLEQFAVDVFLSGGASGGVAIAQTNQTNYTASNAPNFTSNFLSGLHPDVTGSTVGRADNIGFALTSHTSQVQAGSLGLVMLSLGPTIIGTLPVVQIVPFANSPDTIGNVCVDITNAANFFVFMNAPPASANALPNMLEGNVLLNLTAPARTLIASVAGPIDMWWQGFVIDAASASGPLEVRASGCAIQKLK